MTAPRRLTARITRLEMMQPPARRAHAPLGQNIAVMRARAMPVSFYRYLYREIGKPHHWLLRRDADDAALTEILRSDSERIDILYVDGCPAGFFELVLEHVPQSAEILYFGLLPEFHGRGLARFFLSEAVQAAWSHGPERVVVHTNTLDSPRALRLYQQIGFVPVGWSEEEVEPWL